MPHLLPEGYVYSHLLYIFHDEINESLLEANGVIVLSGVVHPGEYVYVHMVSDDIILHQPLEIAEDPPIREMEEAHEIVATDLLGLQAPFAVPRRSAPP